jgi:predicted nucleic acid-binding protein
MHLLLRAGGFPAQRDLWRMVVDGRLVLHDLNNQEIARTAELMDKYRDRPMDLADATIVATAEILNLRVVFAIDQDFHMYRLADGSTLHVIPQRPV